MTPILAADLPVGGPATLLAASPPQALVMSGTRMSIALSVSAGAAQVTPYAWIGSNWYPMGDSANAPKLISADAAPGSVANAYEYFITQAETLTWAFVKTGAGTISYCSVAGGTS